MIWQRGFALLPVRTIEGQNVWLRHIWTREVRNLLGKTKTIYSSADTPPADKRPGRPPRGVGSGRR